MARIFILSDDDRETAWSLAHGYVAQLRAQGLLDTHRIAVEQKTVGNHEHTYWVVLVVDEPEDTTEE